MSIKRTTAKPLAELAAAEIVTNPETGEIIYARNADDQRDVASLTKMATAYMVMRAVASGQIKLDQPIKISAGAALLDNNGFDVGVKDDNGKNVLPEGARLTVREALAVMMTSSANGVAKALGEALAPPKLNSRGKTVPGTERDFAREMTRVMQTEVGMSERTSFINASGLNNGGADQKCNLSTARDMAILNQRLMREFPQFDKLVGAHTATTTVLMPDGEKKKVNSPTTNHFLRDFAKGSRTAQKEGFTAVGPQKTGYNPLSGGINLLTNAENAAGVRLTSVVLGGADSDKRYAANQRNLRNGFARVEAEPALAVAYHRAEGATLYAALSPKTAFDEPKPGKPPARTPVYAQADVVRPYRRFNHTGQRTVVRPVAAPVSLIPVSYAPPPVPDEVVDFSRLDAQLAQAGSMAADPAAPREQQSLKPVVYRTPTTD